MLRRGLCTQVATQVAACGPVDSWTADSCALMNNSTQSCNVHPSGLGGPALAKPLAAAVRKAAARAL